MHAASDHAAIYADLEPDVRKEPDVVACHFNLVPRSGWLLSCASSDAG